MNLRFTHLSKNHFPLMLKWLNTSHVKKWWDEDKIWTKEQVEQKYESYASGYKIENNIKKPINAYIILAKDNPVGYIQIYNAYDFARSKKLEGLPTNLAAFDIFIGEEGYLNQGIGSEAIKLVFKQHQNFTHLFADPDINNLAAIKTYEKAGLKKIDEQLDIGEIWMIKEIRNE